MEGIIDDSSVHDKVLVLKDVALGVKKSSKINPTLSSACYDSTVDSLLALHDECSQATGLSKNRNVTKFLGKYKGTVKALRQLLVTASDFEVRGIIGRGHFGEVQVVQEKSTKEVYAMKVMKKAHILQQSDSACFSEERDIMAWANSPWLTCLHYAFQDSSSLYLVMDYHPGGDLFSIMERRDEGMSEKEARFYLSEIAAGLDDLHQLGFVHRDVKPENVLISRSGHIKLVDFGSAARLGEDGKVVDSHLPVGTPEYIAPEVLTSLDKAGTDYGVCCDWWSLGIIAYELVYVSTPFEGDSTSMTYGNIMNYKESLSFPEDVTTSREFKSLIKSLLTEPDMRPSFAQLKEHSFFKRVDWEHLFSVLPPFIPSVSSPDDISNFDTFEPKRDDDLSAGLPSRPQREFSGKSLPFVGFTFTRLSHSQLEFTDSAREPARHVSDEGGQQWGLERGELKELKERNKALEKECVVYRNQLKDYHQRLERERADRKQSDSKAMKLLEEVKVHSETLRELRKEELSDKEVELNCVVSQLEQDRQVVSNKARRLQTELERVGSERDQAVKVAVELKAKLKALKESSKKDIASLQSRLNQMSKDSSTQSTSIHEKLTDAMEQYMTANKKLKAKEENERKQKLKIQKLETALSSHTAEVKKLKDQLHTLKTKQAEQTKGLEGRIESLSSEKRAALHECEDIKQSNKELRTKLTEANTNLTTREERVKTKSEVTSSLQEEVRTLQRKLNETGETAIKQSERLREVRALKRTLDLENSELKSQLKKAKVDRERLQEQLEGKNKELDSLAHLQTRLTQAEQDLSSERDSNKALTGKLESLQAESDRVSSQKKKTDLKCQTLSDKLAAEELSSALLQRKLKLLEEELAECKGSMEELTAAEKQWKAIKATMTSDLEMAETRLDDALTTIDKDKNARAIAEKKLEELLATLEKMQSSHHQEVQHLQEQLDSQSNLMSQSNKKVLEAEKELKLVELTLKQTQKDLDTEKACYSKAYEDLYSLQRDYRILKAAYNKLHRECDEQRAQLTLTTEVRDRVLNEHKSAAETHQLQETRMQSTIEQQSKLIDYLQGVGASPRSSGLSKLAKGLKFGRKGRDPAKEIAEWNKLKGLIGKPHKISNTSRASVSSQEVSQSSSASSLSSLTSSSTNTSTVGTPISRSTRKAKRPLSTTSPDGAKVTQSTLLSFPVTSLSKKRPRQSSKKDPEKSSTPKDTSLSAEVVKENVDVSSSIAGKKRKHQAMSLTITESDLTEPAEKVLSIRHNIPHNFQLHKSGIHKTYKCSGCNEQIKNLQRYAKCSYCHLVCHHSCVDSFPNDCGLPAELAAHTLPPPASTSKSSSKQKDNEKKELVASARPQPTPTGKTSSKLKDSKNKKTTSTPPQPTSGSKTSSKTKSRIKSPPEELYVSSASSTDDSLIFQPEEQMVYSTSFTVDIVKTEKLTLLRNGLRTLGWLILSRNSLVFHDRNPNHGTTRNPLYSFDLNSSNCIYHTLSDRIELFGCPEKILSKVFGLRKYLSNSQEYQEVLFLAPTLESKIEWVEALGEVFSSLSYAKEQLVYGDAVDGDREEKPVSRKRSLKSVSIVPVKASCRSGGEGEMGSELDLSIRSSMLGDSDSNTSLV